MRDNIKGMVSNIMSKDKLKNCSGFTLPELVITITLLGIISVSFLGIITNYFATITRNNLLIEMTVDSQNLLRAAVEELRYGAGVRQSNTITDPHEPSGGWNTGNANFVIIIAVPAVDSSRNYIIDTATGSPYLNELVYFKQGTTLFKRVLAHPSAVGNNMKTSCPASAVSPTCPADKELHKHVKNMVFTLYDQDNGSTNDPLLARSVKINLSLERDTFGDPLLLDNSIRVTLRNTF